MANVLAWLTGREDRTEDPWPFQPQAELRAFNPPPSERFAHWISGALGAGPGASLAHQRFAEGVPNVLSLFPPLGAGLSAADLLHAKAAGDPMGVAAAALGMLPGAGPLGRKAVNETVPVVKKATGEYGQWLEQQLSGIPAAPKGYALNPATGKYDVLDPKTGKIVQLGQKLPISGETSQEVYTKDANGYFQWFDKQELVNHNGEWFLKPGQTAENVPSIAESIVKGTKTAANPLPSNEGYTLSAASTPDFPDAAKDYFIHDPSGKKIGELTYAPEIKHAEDWTTPEHWQLSMEGVAPKAINSLEEVMKYVPDWHKADAVKERPLQVAMETANEIGQGSALDPHWIEKSNLIQKGDNWYLKEGYKPEIPPKFKEEAAPAKQVLDYEKDDNGLYHIFDALSGKTLKVVDSQFQAKQYIAGQKGTAPWSDFANPELKKTIPITQISTPSPKEVKSPDLLEAQKRYEEAIAPLFQNLPERAVQQGYTTPAFRGLKIREGDVNPVYSYQDDSNHQYSTANPMLADMYADYLSKHPGWHVPGEAFDKGASVAPLLLDTSKYHYYDAAGAHWSAAAGNQRGIQQAREKGAPGVIVDNVWDEPNSTHALGTPSKIFITFPSGASTVKSRFAELFDPTSPNMLKNFAGLAAGGTGLAALLGSDRAQAAAPQRAQVVPPQPLSARINEIIDGLQWQDQWMGRMKLPLQRAAERRRKEQ